MADPIAGKVVAITGGSSGLGEATALHLAARGAKVVVAARRKDRLEGVVGSIKAAGGEARAAVVDVTNKDDVDALVADTVAAYGRLDTMINNAGLMAIAPMDEGLTAEWDRMIDINIKGVLYGIAAALPQFLKQRSGHFINMSSVAGLKVFAPGGAVYSGTKFAVRAISEGLRQELAGRNIRVTTIEPGAIDTELKYGTSDKQSRAAVEQLYTEAAIPADSVARAIAFAMEQPPDVGIDEIVLRPTAQVF